MKRLPSSPPISSRTTVRASREQVSCDLADGVVILSLQRGSYFGLDPVASRIWHLLDEPRAAAAIRDQLLQEYEGVDADRCERELLALLRQLQECGLVDVVAVTEASA